MKSKDITNVEFRELFDDCRVLTENEVTHLRKTTSTEPLKIVLSRSFANLLKK